MLLSRASSPPPELSSPSSVPVPAFEVPPRPAVGEHPHCFVIGICKKPSMEPNRPEGFPLPDSLCIKCWNKPEGCELCQSCPTPLHGANSIVSSDKLQEFHEQQKVGGEEQNKSEFEQWHARRRAGFEKLCAQDEARCAQEAYYAKREEVVDNCKLWVDSVTMACREDLQTQQP